VPHSTHPTRFPPEVDGREIAAPDVSVRVGDGAEGVLPAVPELAELGGPRLLGVLIGANGFARGAFRCPESLPIEVINVAAVTAAGPMSSRHYLPARGPTRPQANGRRAAGALLGGEAAHAPATARVSLSTKAALGQRFQPGPSTTVLRPPHGRPFDGR
jgi:hypothetical protein